MTAGCIAPFSHGPETRDLHLKRTSGGESTFIAQANELGLSLAPIRELVDETPTSARACRVVHDRLTAHLAALDQKLASMRALRQILDDHRRACAAALAAGPDAECPTLRSLRRRATITRGDDLSGSLPRQRRSSFSSCFADRDPIANVVGSGVILSPVIESSEPGQPLPIIRHGSAVCVQHRRNIDRFTVGSVQTVDLHISK